jgi:hypothetical protein
MERNTSRRDAVTHNGFSRRSKFMADKEKKEVTASPIDALSESNQALAESLSAAQERNLKYAQSVFESTLALLKSHAESARSLLEQWEQQAQQQPGDPKAAETYVGFFRAPLAAYQRALEAVETASRQSLESFQTATESLQKAMQQGREQWQEAARQAQRSTGKPEK